LQSSATITTTTTSRTTKKLLYKHSVGLTCPGGEHRVEPSFSPFAVVKFAKSKQHEDRKEAYIAMTRNLYREITSAGAS